MPPTQFMQQLKGISLINIQQYGSLTIASPSGQNRPGSNGNEEVIYTT